MTVKSMVGTLTRTGVSTAVSVVRHPIGTASLAAGLVKGTAEAGASLVRSTITGQMPAPIGDIRDRDAAEVASVAAVEPAPEPAPEPAATVSVDPRDDIPGPDLAAFDPPAPEDLPEPIVIVADARVEEAFHTEPKASSRDSEHGGPAGDREEIEGYAEEIVLDDLEVETDAISPVAAPSRE